MESLSNLDSVNEYFDEKGNLLIDHESLDAILNEEPLPPNQQRNGKIYQRYSREEQRRLEELYQKNDHPTDKERKALSQELGLDPIRVKFWFQNRRTLAKRRQGKISGWKLKAENEKLEAENEVMKKSLASVYCEDCLGYYSREMQARIEHLRAENDLIREEIKKVTRMVDSRFGNGTMAKALLEAPTVSATETATASALASSTPVGDIAPYFSLLRRNYFGH